MVEEQPTGEIMLAAGAGTNGLTIGGGVKEKNFAGKGVTLNTDIEITEESDDFKIKTKTDNQLNYAIKLLNG